MGDKVLRIKRDVKRKYSKHKSDPYKIINVHTNGTVTIAQGVKHQTISIRNIEPYYRKKFRIMSIVTSQIWGGGAVDAFIYVGLITNPGFTCLSGLGRLALHTYIYSPYFFKLDCSHSVTINL